MQEWKPSESDDSPANVQTNRATGKKSEFVLPDTVESGKGVSGKFTVSGYEYRIDTNKVAPGEGGFHIHVYRKIKKLLRYREEARM